MAPIKPNKANKAIIPNKIGLQKDFSEAGGATGGGLVFRTVE